MVQCGPAWRGNDERSNEALIVYLLRRGPIAMHTASSSGQPSYVILPRRLSSITE